LSAFTGEKVPRNNIISSDEEGVKRYSMDEDNVCIAGMDHMSAPAIPQDGEGARMFGAHSASGAGSNPTTLPF